jgi:hypothetical protein
LAIARPPLRPRATAAGSFLGFFMRQGYGGRSRLSIIAYSPGGSSGGKILWPPSPARRKAGNPTRWRLLS